MQRPREGPFEGAESNIQVDLGRLVNNYIDLLLREGALLLHSADFSVF